MAETLIFSVDIVDATSKLAQIRVDVEAYKKQQQELTAEVKKGNTQAAEAYEVLGGAIRNLQGEQRNLTKQVDGYVAVQKKQTDQQKFQNNSIQQNRDLLKQLTAQYINLKNPSQQATDQIKKLSDTLKQQESAIGDNRRNVGNYKDALAQLPGALGNATQSSMRLFDTLKANPYIAIIGLVYQFINALKQNEKVAEFFERAMAGVQAQIQFIADTTVELVSKLGFLKNAFSDPVGTIKQLGEIIKNNLLNRLKSLGGFIEAISLAFENKWGEAARKAANSAMMLTTGIDGLSDKMFDNIKAAVEAKKVLQDLEEKQRDLELSVAKTNVEIEKQKNIQAAANNVTERQKAANKIIELEGKIRDAKVANAKEEAKALQDLADANKGNEDLKNKAIAAQIKEQQILAEFYTSTRKAQNAANDELVEDSNLVTLYNKNLKDLQKTAKEGIDIIKDGTDGLGDIVRKEVESVENVINDIPTALERAREGFEEFQAQLLQELPKINEGFSVAMMGLDAISIGLQTNITNRINDLNEQTEAQIEAINQQAISEEEKEKKILKVRENAAKKEEQLEKKSARQQQAIQSIQAIISGALAIIQSLANTTLPFPASLAAPVAIGAITVANVAAINAQKFEDGGAVELADGGRVIPIHGKSHSAGGEDVYVGRNKVANIEGNEGMFIMKKNAFQAINKYSNINKAFGGNSWTKKTRYAADGGQLNATVPATESFRNVSNQIVQSELMAEAFRNMPAQVLSITELERRTAIKDKSVRISEL